MGQMQRDVDLASAAQTEAHSRSASSPSNVTPHDGTVTPPDGVIPAANRGPVRAMLTEASPHRGGPEAGNPQRLAQRTQPRGTLLLRRLWDALLHVKILAKPHTYPPSRFVKRLCDCLAS